MQLSSIIIYDDATFHYKGNWPDNLEKKQAYVHTGLYLYWLIKNNLTGSAFNEMYRYQIEDCLNKIMTGPQLFMLMGGIFRSDILTDKGKEFTEYYFSLDSGNYMYDYEFALARYEISPYHVSDTWANYEKLSRYIDQRYASWLDYR